MKSKDILEENFEGVKGIEKISKTFDHFIILSKLKTC
jgi:hypothetical protein